MRPVRWALGYARRHPGRATALVGLGLAVAVFGIVWFEPHKLFVDDRVDEALPRSPVAASMPPAATDASPLPTEPVTFARGMFQSLEHESSGLARVIELPDGERVLRFEDLSTSNGPDLRVYLSEIPASDDWHAYGVRFVDLGDLKGNEGNQNYGIPAGTDLSKVKSAVIWCRRFEVGFAVAPLDGLATV